MSKRIFFAVPGDLETPTGGYAYDRRVIAELRTLGWQIDLINLGDGFPRPTSTQLARAQAALAATAASAPIVIDGLAFGVMADATASLARTHVLIALVHHPLALETGLTAGEAAALQRSEQAALVQARGVIVTSAQTAQILVSDYAVPNHKITVAPPGNDSMPMAPANNATVHLLSVGALVPRKGYDVLLAALHQLIDLLWKLSIVGDETRDPQTAARLRAAVAAAGLGERIAFRGALSDADLAAAYQDADVFVTASHFEGYGMAAATALACGLPIVATRGGALGDTLAGAAVIVPLNDAPALSAALRRVCADNMARSALRSAARAAARNLPTWRSTAEIFARAIEGAA